MANITQVPDHYVIQYETNWQMLLQQMDSRLKERTKLVTANGAAVRFNQLDSTSMVALTQRNQATNNYDINLPARWAYPTPYNVSNWFDEFDSTFLGNVVLPTSEVMQAQVAAYGRAVDSALITALTAASVITNTANTPSNPAFVVNNTTTTVALPAGQQVAVGYVGGGGTATNSGLTIAKIREAKRILDSNEAPSEDRILVVSAKEIADLLGTQEVTNQLYNSVRALVDGEVDSFLGFKVVRSELLAASGTPKVRTCIAYQKNSAVLVDAGRKAYMDILPTNNHSLQIRSTAVFGATRLLEKGVVSIACDDTK
jgi:Phage capsid protein